VAQLKEQSEVGEGMGAIEHSRRLYVEGNLYTRTKWNVIKS